MRVNTRIEVVGLMRDDPLPPPLGARGTVIEYGPAVINYDDGINYKVHIRWDEGIVAVSTLLIPGDSHVFRVIS